MAATAMSYRGCGFVVDPSTHCSTVPTKEKEFDTVSHEPSSWPASLVPLSLILILILNLS